MKSVIQRQTLFLSEGSFDCVNVYPIDGIHKDLINLKW